MSQVAHQLTEPDLGIAVARRDVEVVHARIERLAHGPLRDLR